jgi:hypothetical protein
MPSPKDHLVQHDGLRSGRVVPRVYPVSGRSDVHQFLLGAVERSGGTALFSSSPQRVPVYLGVGTPDGARVGLMVYPIRVTKVPTRNRPTNEARGQLRYGSEESWLADDHYVARDVAGVDTTLMLGVYLEADLLVGLDPALYDPMPLGISAVYLKDEQVDEVRESGWAVWERETRAGKRRLAPRAEKGIETLVAFSPERLLDYASFERNASALGLDPPLRHAAATDAASSHAAGSTGVSRHALESSFDLAAHEILDIIQNRMRLEVAVKGGVAEHHLERLLKSDPAVRLALSLDLDSQPDFDVEMVTGVRVLVECKNASPDRYANGDFKVEVQKTRATRDDPAGRLYRPDQFDVVAACLYSATRRWEFRYKLTAQLQRHNKHPERLAATHRVDATWSERLDEALEGHASQP